MTYATTLIISFRFDCGRNGIEDTDALIRQQGIWQRAAYSDQNAVKSIADLYNTSGSAAMYTADGDTVNRLFGSRQFRVTAGQEQYDYAYDRLTLFVFATGTGFLCTGLSVKDPAALRRLHTVVSKNIKHFKKTGRESYEELPMTTVIEKLLDFTRHQTFFTSPHPSVYAQAGMLVYAFNDGETDNDAVIDGIFADAGDTVTKRLKPFPGVAWGISARCVAMVTNPECRIASTQLQANVTLHYLPLIILALHRQAAAFWYNELINAAPADEAALKEEIAAFQNTFFPENVSDASIKQQVYNEVRRLNPSETAPLEAFLAKEPSGNFVMEKLLGAISLIFSVGSIFSILSDGINVIQEVVPESMKQIARYGMYALCIALAVLGICGVYLLFKPKKK